MYSRNNRSNTTQNQSTHHKNENLSKSSLLTKRVCDNFLTSDGLQLPDKSKNVLVLDFGVNISQWQNNKTVWHTCEQVKNSCRIAIGQCCCNYIYQPHQLNHHKTLPRHFLGSDHSKLLSSTDLPTRSQIKNICIYLNVLDVINHPK